MIVNKNYIKEFISKIYIKKFISKIYIKDFISNIFSIINFNIYFQLYYSENLKNMK